MTRLRAVPEPFIAIVFGLLIGAAVNIFSIDPGALRNMQACALRPNSLLIAASLTLSTA